MDCCGPQRPVGLGALIGEKSAIHIVASYRAVANIPEFITRIRRDRLLQSSGTRRAHRWRTTGRCITFLARTRRPAANAFPDARLERSKIETILTILFNYLRLLYNLKSHISAATPLSIDPVDGFL
jgi:hypothetical protein